jgi:hypothetical protein
MNFLELSQRTAAECGVSGTLTTTSGQQGSLLRIVNWVKEAWIEIQTEHDDWTFMRSSKLLGAGVSFPTVSGQLFYKLGVGAGKIGLDADDFGKWDMDSFRCQTTSVGIQDETYLDNLIDFDVWRDAYMYGANQNVITRPVAIVEGPENQLCIGPASDGNYTITGDFIMSEMEMSNDTDEPTNRLGTFTLPRRFQMRIVYKAMEYYAAYESAPEVHQRAINGTGKLKPKMEALYLPEFGSGSALA